MIEAVVGDITEAATGKAIDLLVGEDQFQEWLGKDQAKDAPCGWVSAYRWAEACPLAAAPALSWEAPPHASVARMSTTPTIIVRDTAVPTSVLSGVPCALASSPRVRVPDPIFPTGQGRACPFGRDTKDDSGLQFGSEFLAGHHRGPLSWSLVPSCHTVHLLRFT